MQCHSIDLLLQPRSVCSERKKRAKQINRLIVKMRRQVDFHNQQLPQKKVRKKLHLKTISSMVSKEDQKAEYRTQNCKLYYSHSVFFFPPLITSMFGRVKQMRKYIISLFLIVRRIKSYCSSDLQTDPSMAADTNLKKQATDEQSEMQQSDEWGFGQFVPQFSKCKIKIPIFNNQTTMTFKTPGR